MTAFKELTGETAVVLQGGVYKQSTLYEWDGKLFAACAGGFLRLNRDGSTSKAQVRLVHLAYEGPLYADRFGRLTVVNGSDRKPVQALPDGTLKLLEN